MINNTDRARDALHTIPPNLPRDDWHKAGRAAIAAGLTIDDLDTWSATADNYAGTRDVQAAFRTISPDGGTGEGTLYAMARDYGFTDGGKPQQRTSKPQPRPIEAPAKPRPGMSAAEIFARCQPATNAHDYIVRKGAAGVPLDGLRVVPDGDPLTIRGQSMAGALVVPAYAPSGELQSLQFIPRDGGDKLNLPAAKMAGASFTVGTEGPVYVCEGVGAAWACYQATGHRAACCFGWGNVGTIAVQLRQREPDAKLVICPDTGKESDAAKIAAEVSGLVAAMPDGWPKNSDVNDLAQREGVDVLEALLQAATEPPKPDPRYKLLNSGDLAALPPLQWRVRGVLPAVGLAGLYGPSASGKSFLAFDMAAAIANGTRWFDCRVEAAPVVYAALEGEAGFKLRAQAWEAHQGKTLPAGLHMVLQPFKLTEPQDVKDLAAVVPAGAVVFLDTLNRAAPTADENSSRDMGEILEAAKRLQRLTGGLVVLVHHTGKDATKGLRGHSSLFAALDAAVEVSRDGDRREWRCAKSKDGQDGDAQAFKLNIEALGFDDYGDPVTSCVVMPDHSERDVKRVKVPQGGNQSLVYSAIRGMFKDGISGKPGAPPLRPCIELEAAVIRGAAALTCDSDKRTSRTRLAITGLVSRGVLGLNEGFLWTV